MNCTTDDRTPTCLDFRQLVDLLRTKHSCPLLPTSHRQQGKPMHAAALMDIHLVIGIETKYPALLLSTVSC